MESVRAHQRRAVREPHDQLLEVDRAIAAGFDDMNSVGAACKFVRRDDPRLKSIEAVHHGLPLRKLAIGADEERQGAVNAVSFLVRVMMASQFSTTCPKRTSNRSRSAGSPRSNAICSEFSRTRTR